MVEHQPSKLDTWVRFPSPAFLLPFFMKGVKKQQIIGHVLACGTQMMWILFPHTLKIVDKKRELAFAGAGLFGIVLYFILENTALTMTYASNVGIIVACAPFFVAVIVGIFFKNEKPEIILNFLFLGVGASALGFFLWNLSTKWIGAIKTSVYIYVSLVVLSVVILHEKMTFVSVTGALLILLGLIVSQKKINQKK